MKILIAYYSRTGTTQKVAQQLAKELNAEGEEIIDQKKRGGFFGFIGAGADAWRQRLTNINSLKKNPGDYDLVIIGTPIWAGRMTPAVRTYLTENKGKFKRVAFFITSGGADESRVWPALQSVCGLKPAATLALLAKQVASGSVRTPLKEWAKKLRD